MQNQFNTWMKFRNVLPDHKNGNTRSSTVHLHGIDLIDTQILE